MTYNTQIGRFCDMNSNYEQLLCEKLFAYDKNPVEYMKIWNSSKLEKELKKWEIG